MFNRQAYKKIAKMQLKNRLKGAIIITLLGLIFISIASVPEIAQSFKENMALVNSTDFSVDNVLNDYDGLNFNFSAKNSVPVKSPFSFLAWILSYFITGAVTLAGTFYYINMHKTTETVSVARFFEGFSLSFKGFIAILWQGLWVFLWSLLFVIPGIVKAISYSQMYYILAEYPKVSPFKAMRISKTMTKGFKADLFVMYLSFIGWGILNVFTFNILWICYLGPYFNMSFVNAYYAMKEHALKTGTLTLEDFGEENEATIEENNEGGI